MLSELLLAPTQAIETFVREAPLWLVFAVATFLFAALYFSMALLGYGWTRGLGPRLGLGRVVDGRPLFRRQVLFEIRYSVGSTVIFGFYGFLQAAAIRRGWLTVDFTVPAVTTFALDILVLFFWNELHFYLVHRLLHRKWFYDKVHWIHHKSTTPTPFSTYSFHWFEALSLSSVMILIMPFYTLNIWSVFLFPGVSIFWNVVGHLNYTVFADKPITHVAQASARHALHHHYYKGNYGFVVPWIDQILKTDLKRTPKT